MKRLLTVFAAMAALMMVAGTALAEMTSLPPHFYDNGAVITSVTWMDGLEGKYGPEWDGKERTLHGVSGYRQVDWGNSKLSYFQLDGRDAKGDLDEKTTDYFTAVDGLYGYEANYLYFDIENGKGLDANYKQPGKIEVYTGANYYWGEKGKGGVYQGFFDTVMELYFLSGVGGKTGETDLVFMQNEFFRLGEFTVYGTTYYLDIQIDISKGHKYVQLEGPLYDQAYAQVLAMGGSMTYGDVLWGQYLDSDAKTRIKFDILAMDRDRLNNPPAVPVPAAVWLMGSGLAGLAALRRKMS